MATRASGIARGRPSAVWGPAPDVDACSARTSYWHYSGPLVSPVFELQPLHTFLDKPRSAAGQIFFLERTSTYGFAAHILLYGNGAADRSGARARCRTRQPVSGDGAVIRLLRETRQKIGLAIGRFRPRHANSSRGLQPPDLAAPGALGFALEVPKRIGVKKILRLTGGACKQHRLSPHHFVRYTPVLPVAAGLPRSTPPVCPGCARCPRPPV